jgi:hypothetical protein
LHISKHSETMGDGLLNPPALFALAEFTVLSVAPRWPHLQVKVHQECTKTSTVKIPAKPESTCAPAHSFSYHQI